MPEPKDLLKKLLGQVPEGFENQHSTLLQIFNGTREKIAEALAPALNAKLKTMPQQNYGEKQRVADWVNETLRGMGLTVRNSKGEPALLKARAGHNPTETGGEYFLESTDEKGSRHREPPRGGWDELPELELMPADLSRLSHVEQAIAKFSGR